jgi:predicted aspartyl protease
MRPSLATSYCLAWLTCAGPISALSAAEPVAAAPTNFVSLPFQLQRGHVMLPTRLQGTNELSLLLDTGYGMTMLHPELVEAAGLRRTGRITIVGIAGEEPASVFEGPEFAFAGFTWKPRRVAALLADNQGRSRRRDGVLGSGFFRRFVVEIHSRDKTVALHEPDRYVYSGAGEVLPLTFKSTTPIVEALIRLPDESETRAQLEVDTGCDGGLCLGRHFVEAHQLSATNTPTGTGERVGVGGGTRTRRGRLPQLRLSRLTVERPSANFFLEGSPSDPPLAGHIGWDVLRQFKVVFDYRRQRMILEEVK